MLAELIAIPSVTGSAAESEAQRWVASQCERIGLDVDLWSCDLAKLRADPGYPGTEVERTEAWGLVAVTPGASDASPRLALQGHVDVVPTGDLAQWVHGAPFSPRVFEGVMFGRGACDMKA
ncbi:MAG: M20/M25/M40 family metallo-hydrolase, partial [Candidatus Nanopelagicales bacterium]